MSKDVKGKSKRSAGPCLIRQGDEAEVHRIFQRMPPGCSEAVKQRQNRRATGGTKRLRQGRNEVRSIIK